MIQPVILAAGKGTRMRSTLPKALFKVEGKPMLEHVLDAFLSVEGYAEPVVVVGRDADVIINRFKDRAHFALQKDINGTASAAKAALPSIAEACGSVLFVYGDQPFLRKETLRRISADFDTTPADLLVGTVTVPHFNAEYAPFNAFGRILKNASGSIQGIVEYKSASEVQRNIKELNAGPCLADTKWLKHALPFIKPNKNTGEYYLTELVAVASYEGKTIRTFELRPEEALGINTPEDAAQVRFFNDATF